MYTRLEILVFYFVCSIKMWYIASILIMVKNLARNFLHAVDSKEQNNTGTITMPLKCMKHDNSNYLLSVTASPCTNHLLTIQSCMYQLMYILSTSIFWFVYNQKPVCKLCRLYVWLYMRVAIRLTLSANSYNTVSSLLMIHIHSFIYILQVQRNKKKIEKKTILLIDKA